MENVTSYYWPKEWVERYQRQGFRENQSLSCALDSLASYHQHRVALVEGSQRVSYTDLAEQVASAAAGFLHRGIRSGQRVLVQLPNSLDFVVSCFALFRLGAVPIMVMPGLREKELTAVCSVGEPVACIVPDRFLGFDHVQLAEKLMVVTPSMTQIFVAGETVKHCPLQAVANVELREQLASYSYPHPEQLAFLLLSGGTTGTPKLIPRTHADYLYNARASASLCGFNQDTVYLAALPVAHNFPLGCPGVIGTLINGGKVVLATTPGFDSCFPLIEQEAVTVTALVPALVPSWLEALQWDDSDISSLVLLQIGGARLSPELARRIAPEMNCQLQQVFGMAEGLLCFTRLDDPQDIVINTQGRPLCESDDVCVVDANGCPVPDGNEGELWVKGPYTIRGYYKADAHNLRSFSESGYYQSGDKVIRDTDGNISVVGRIKEQINRAGEKIACAEIEALLSQHAGIQDVVSIAVPDERLGERHCLCVLSEDVLLSLSDIQLFLRQQGLARYKLPDQYIVCPHWPLTAIGKIDRISLIQQAIKEAGDTASNHSLTTLPLVRYLQTYSDTSQHPPLMLATAMMRQKLAEEMALYEHPDSIRLYVGCLARITLVGQQLHLNYDEYHHSWPVENMAQFPSQLEIALKLLPLDTWSAWGSIPFEYARAIYDMPLLADIALFELIIPMAEVRLYTAKRSAADESKHTCIEYFAIDTKSLTTVQTAFEMSNRQPRRVGNHSLISTPIATANQEVYKEQVKCAVAEINAGHYQKVILSRQVPIDEPVDMVESYLKGRQHNTPARSFLLKKKDFKAAGFCPETIIEVGTDNTVSTQPLAGTRARVSCEKTNQALRKELLSDPKEIAEHAISVKLAMEELAPICNEESLGVSEFMNVCQRGTVQHLGSRVKGQLQPTITCWHALNALFPAVTASGIPKRESIDAIGRFELQPRGLYSGSVFIADSDGRLDAALVLRAFYQQGEQQWLQAGAGLVGLSTPERELEETREKLASAAMHLLTTADAEVWV